MSGRRRNSFARPGLRFGLGILEEAVTPVRRLSLCSSAWLLALVVAALVFSAGEASAQAGKLAVEPVSLPDMALGASDAPVTIIEYSSMTCSHCAAFEQSTFRMLKSKYIDAGAVRFVFREFPLDNNSAGASMLARCIGNGDPQRYFSAVDTLFRRQDQLVANAMGTLRAVGQEAGMSDPAIDHCLNDADQYRKLDTDRRIAVDMVKVDRAPTFFINGRMYTGNMAFEEMDKIIRWRLRR
jgi:protein-disulfide isomerase